jgi:hypothetical protein
VPRPVAGDPQDRLDRVQIDVEILLRRIRKRLEMWIETPLEGLDLGTDETLLLRLGKRRADLRVADGDFDQSKKFGLSGAASQGVSAKA